MNKIHSGILSLAWHPEKDNILAFSTREGRIGVLDVNKSSNVPTVLAGFSSQEVYSIGWARIQDSVVLIACNGQKMVHYSQKDQWKMKAVEHLKNSSSIAVNGDILAVGMGSGDLFIADITNDFKVLMTKKICKKYIGMMSWHGSTLVIASESGITVIKSISAITAEIPDEELLKLEGHKGRVFSVRFNKSGSMLVSCCVSGYVKVWNLSTMTSVASFNMETLAYSAIFLPSNEDFIVCGGQDSTVLTFEWKNHPASEEILAVKKKLHQKGKNIQWAAPIEVTKISKHSSKRQKQKIVKVVDDSIVELSGDVMKMNLQPVSSRYFLQYF